MTTTLTSDTKISHIPRSVKIHLSPVRRMYIARLLNRGLSGSTVEEVLDTLLCLGLQQRTDAQDMMDVQPWLALRAARKRRKRK